MPKDKPFPGWPENPYLSKNYRDSTDAHYFPLYEELYQEASDACAKAIIKELERLQKKWESIKGTDDEYMDGYKECSRDRAYALKTLISKLRTSHDT